jgi:flagellin
MGMAINTNVDALDALRNLGTTASKFSASVQKLSSGLRINTAADDAAGYAISNKLQAQVTGLNQAQRNAQDGVSMVQTAAGGITEIQSMLQRIRELGVEAGNATVGSSDAKSINTEISALSDEINRIAGATSFNGQNLLAGSLSVAMGNGGSLTVGKALNTGHIATVSGIDVSGAKAGSTYALATNSAGSLTMTVGTLSQTVNLQAMGSTGTEAINFAQLGVRITVAGDPAKTAVELATDLAGASGGGTPGQPSTIGFNGMAAQGLGTVVGGGTLTNNTAIDDVANGLLTSTTPTSDISGLSNIGAGLDGVVTTFTKGLLPDGNYALAVTNTGSASTVGGVNTSATVNGSTAVDDPVNGLWTATAGGSDIATWMYDRLTAGYWNSGSFGTGGTMNSPTTDTGGTLTGALWEVKATSGNCPIGAATFTLRDRIGGTVINLQNDGTGVLTDAASGFHLDLSGLTGQVATGAAADIKFSPNVGATPGGFEVMDAAGNSSYVNASPGETFQQVADDINSQATTGGAMVTASVGAHGLILSNAGASPNSATQIQVSGVQSLLIGLGFMQTQALPSAGYVWEDSDLNINGTGGAADSVTGTLTNTVTNATYTLSGSGNVLSDTNALNFHIDLSAVTGGSLHTGSATLTSNVSSAGVDTSSPRTLRLIDENGAAQTFTLTAGETFQTLMNAINGSGLAIHAAMGSPAMFGNDGLALINTGTDLAGSISAQGSDNVLRGLGLEASDGNAADTGNSVTVTGSLGTVTIPGGGGGTATIVTAAGAVGQSVFQVGANANETVGVNFASVTTTALSLDAAITGFNAAQGANWTGSQKDAVSALLLATDTAIGTLNNTASNLGAVQNRLGHTIAAVGVASENLNASESRIKDLDVASEMVNFTKTQILQQAGTAILAQANSAPQSILTLLR